MDKDSWRDIRAKVDLSREELAHLYGGGVLSVNLEGKGVGVKIELTCRDAPAERVTRILYRRVSV